MKGIESQKGIDVF